MPIAHLLWPEHTPGPWDNALEDAIKSVSIQPSLTGYISKGIALCGQGHVREARAAFDVASMFTNQDSETHFLLLTKAIALFSADQHDEAMLLIKELAAACPTTDLLGCRLVETYLRIQLGINAFDGARHDEAADHFTVAVDSGAFSSKIIHWIYEDLAVLFGWDIESLCLTAHQKRCQAFLSAGKPDEALEAHKYMMDAIDESAEANCLDWSNGKLLNATKTSKMHKAKRSYDGKTRSPICAIRWQDTFADMRNAIKIVFHRLHYMTTTI